MTVITQPIVATGAQGFLQWLKDRQPYLYGRIAKRIPAPQLAGLGGLDPVITTASTQPTSSTIVDALKTLVLGAGQVLLTKEQLKAQQKIVDLQLERARAGLAPLDIDPTEYGLPAPSVKLGVDADAKRILTIGGLVLGAGFFAYLILGARPRRRR